MTSVQNSANNKITCRLLRTLYHDQCSDFSVLLVTNNLAKRAVNDDLYSYKVTGRIQKLKKDTSFEAQGYWKTHPKYGLSFQVVNYDVIQAHSTEGICQYLASGIIPGVGNITAKRIVDAFGEDTLRVMEETPERLSEIKGISKKKRETIIEGWKNHRAVQDIMVFLNGLDIGPATINKIFKAYGNDGIKIISNNPYRLMDDIEGIGFKKADAIATKVGIPHDSFERLKHGILYVLNQYSSDGDCYAIKEDLVNKSARLLGVDEPAIIMTMDNLVHNQDVITERLDVGHPRDSKYIAVYPRVQFFSERGIAEKLVEITRGSRSISFTSKNLISRVSNITGMKYDPIQEQAILKAATSKVAVITGGPGTGKTTIIKGIIAAYQMANADVLLAAPTGKAAKRMQEATEMNACTIHRLLKALPGMGFQKDEHDPLRGDVLIVDECSMIDNLLMYSLLRAIPDNMSLVLVGDIDQLPSVGAGNVLRDIISSNCIPTVKLQHIFRQAGESKIISNAHIVNEGKMPNLSNDDSSDFLFQVQGTQEEIQKKVLSLISKELPEKYNVSPQSIQVLSPMKKGIAGTDSLNLSLQDLLNPKGAEFAYNGKRFRVGDRVMQIQNDYNKGVFNGDTGIVKKIDREEETLLVQFDDVLISYACNELDNLVLSYATTVHKSQGSEYQVVIMPITTSHQIMLQRNLVYTGITRAKKLFVMVGDPYALYSAVKNAVVTKRNTRLTQRIQDAFA